MAYINIDREAHNQDWIKVMRWNLPPYKSAEFFEIVSEEELDDFRKTPVYKAAVRKGLIVDDEWVGPGE